MNKQTCLKMVLTVFLLSFLTPAFAEDFSADMVSKMGNQVTQSKLYVSGDKIRMDMKEGVMITRMDKQLSWMLMPSDKMYMEHPIDMSQLPKTSKDLDGEMERTPLGTETVDGQQAEKFKVAYTQDGKTNEVYQWLVNDIPIKVEAVNGSFSMEYKNMIFGPQPASLFEIPAGYEKMQMPAMDIGGMSDMIKGMMK